MRDYVQLAVRAFTERVVPDDQWAGLMADPPREQVMATSRPRRWLRPRMVVVFDTETATDLAGALLFGCARVYRLTKPGANLVEECLFYADDLDQRDPVGFRRLKRYAERRDVPLRSRREFINQVLWPVGYKARGWIVGLNLPFDLSRLAVEWKPRHVAGARGFNLALWDYEDNATGGWTPSRFRPRISIETIDSKRSRIRFGRVKDPKTWWLIPEDDPHAEPDINYTFLGNFLDLRTLAFALTGEGHTLGSACEAFKVKHPKQKVSRHGVITAEYIDYCRRDVLASFELLEALLTEYERHPIGLRPTKAGSPASIAKAYLREMGITPFLEQHRDFPKELLGQAMVSYVGGRVETRLRRQLVPVTYVDFLSMYPTVNANMGLWQFFTCVRIDHADATAEARRLVATVAADDLLRRDTWKELTVLCLVEPDGETLPARGIYQGNGAWQIGINPLTSRTPLWMTLADVIAAKLLGGRAPHIQQAVRLTPIGTQEGLKTVKLLGEIQVDPYCDDFFQVIVEERARLKQRHDLPKAEREWRRLLLKVIVNAASYGITAEMNPKRLGHTTAPITVYALDGPFVQRLHEVEEPGRYCFPPLAAFITGAARLMLALLERCVADLGGTHVMADTDSMAIVANKDGGPIACDGGNHRLPGGTAAVRALSHADVQEIVDRFQLLSPYDPDVIGSVLKVEDVNFDENGERLDLHAFSISAKRYALLTPDD